MSENFDLSKILADLDAKIAAKKINGNPDQKTPSFEVANRIDIPHTTDEHTMHSGVVKHNTMTTASEKENETRNFIESNQQTVSEILIKLLTEKKIVMVGEVHSTECDQLRRDVTSALPILQKEGLTHLALETDSSYQEIIDSTDYQNNNQDIIKKLREDGVGNGWDGLTFDILIMAKRLGIKIILIDYHDETAEKTQNYIQTQNIRDAHMAQTLMGNLDEGSRALVYIGTDHVERINNASVKRLRAHLSDAYGNENVGSIRNVSGNQTFDCSHNGSTPSEIFGNNRSGKAFVVRDEGPVGGNRDTDYINYSR